MYSIRHVSHCLVLLTVFYSSIQSIYFYKNNYHGIFTFKLSSNYIYYFTLSLSYIGVIQRLFAVIVGFAGLVFYDCFPGPVKMKADLSKLPRISFRIVTRGDYPKLVTKNANLIKTICSEIQLKNFIIEVVTEKAMHLPLNVAQIVVPQSYRTKNGTLFKGRNLQYCLEEGVSCLSDEDWIVHLDEDSILTSDAPKGIVNFISEGKYFLGIGTISYDPDNLTGTLTQMLVANSVIWDKGYLTMFSNILNEFPSGAKGSFVVCNNRVEKEIAFDGGPSSSIVEFIYFFYNAHIKGYRKGFVEGEIFEQGTLTVKDFLNQVTRLSMGFNYLGENEIIRGKYWVMFQLNRTLIQGYLLYLMSLLITLFTDFEFQSGIFLNLIGLIIAHDIYVGIFHLYRKYDDFSMGKAFLFLIVNLAFGTFFNNVVLAIAHCVSCFQKKPRFTVSKKSN